MDDEDQYMETLRVALIAWDKTGEEGRRRIADQAMVDGNDAVTTVLGVGCLTLELLRRREISISKLSIETSETSAATLNGGL